MDANNETKQDEQPAAQTTKCTRCCVHKPTLSYQLTCCGTRRNTCRPCLEYRRVYAKKWRDRQSRDRIKCACGSQHMKASVAHHVKTVRHIKWINAQSGDGAAPNPADQFTQRGTVGIDMLIECPCGSVLKPQSIMSHRHTNKHLIYETRRTAERAAAAAAN